MHDPLPPCEWCFVFWGGFLERLLRNPARLVTRSPRSPRSCRGGASDRDMVATLLYVASRSRPARASRHGHDGPLRRDPARQTGLAFFRFRSSFTIPVALVLVP
ncbi:hypothetical protein Taro_045036 [Colocasia esculenta]|uniref:Uncharacterized protein n=1 Tax=Colocasia esculenta TaxID=4460 RepID=A0A843WQ69_COLES|nr:hypothetical protein [Colocasia esculenta]